MMTNFSNMFPFSATPKYPVQGVLCWLENRKCWKNSAALAENVEREKKELIF